MIRVEQLGLTAGSFALSDVSFHVASGEYFVLMGPNGSGKTLLMSCLCGIVRCRAGKIIVDGRDVTRLEPRRRNVGYVPQDYGLFPHLNVERNLTFSLIARGLTDAKYYDHLNSLVAMLRLGGLLKRMPGVLSGGERQKVAFARALAPMPKILMLDEPVNALDRPTCREVLSDLRRVQRELGVTTIHICHDLTEAAAVADRAGVMIAGRLVQTGTLAELAASPADAAVARLLDANPTALKISL
ncbi:MAG: ATP-binding cassette domain-containing protein [Planctomycetes bacterium]|nr:ATP-binding cassette domain-containing protein [Planctomycetota bacterium]